MKILIVEEGQYDIYGRSLSEAFEKNGYKEVRLFSWQDELADDNGVYKRIQNKLARGPIIAKINRRLLQECEDYEPDLVFLYRCRLIFFSTVKKIKSEGAVIFSYNNDNPFSAYYPKYFWRHYRRSIRYDDVTFVYRKSNIEQCIQKGSQQVVLLRSYYIASQNYPMKNDEKKYDVVFLGHYENDDRLKYIDALTTAGIQVGVPSVAWAGIREENECILRLENTMKEYNTILNESKIALVFLSSLNHDTYTRRCFEIPATKTFMLSQYTDDLASMFEPDKEAVYFKTPDELVEKAKYYLEHEDERDRIAKAGYDRLMRDGHEIGDRVQQIMDKYYEVVGGKL